MRKTFYLVIVCFMPAWMAGCGRKAPMPAEAEDATEYHAPYQDKETLKAVKPAENDPVIGIYVCDETSDRYIFYDDGTGSFKTGDTESEFEWQHKDGLVTVTFPMFGKEYMYYDNEKRVLKEESEIHARVLVFKKIA